MSKFIEVITENKGAIIKKGLVVLGTIAGLAIASSVFKKTDEDEMIEVEFDDETEEKDEDDSQED